MARKAFDAKVAEELKEPPDPRDAELAALRARVSVLEGVIARSLAECREMQRQTELTPWPFEWERRIDDLETALVGAYPCTRGDEEWEKLNAQLADAAEVMSAMREDLEETLGYAPEYFRDKWDLGSSLKKLDEYKAKCGVK